MHDGLSTHPFERASMASGASGGLLRVRLELVAKLPLLELLSEALVVAPEEANIRDVKEHHSQTLQAKPAAPQPAVNTLFTVKHKACTYCMLPAHHTLEGKRVQYWLGDKHYPAVETNQLAELQAKTSHSQLLLQPLPRPVCSRHWSLWPCA